jgi:mycofactocin precursor
MPDQPTRASVDATDPVLEAASIGCHPDEKLSGGEDEELILEDLLVEDVSIDGMCGVY